MTPGQSANIARFNALAATHGEPVTRGALTVSLALIDRAAKHGRIDKVSYKDGKMDFDLLAMSKIEILFSDIPAGTAIPAAGDCWLDTVGTRHRVQYVGQTNVSFELFCKTSRV